jgi:hypothetical protein
VNLKTWATEAATALLVFVAAALFPLALSWMIGP